MATYLEKGISGTQFDAARVILGGDWRIPTKAEYEELIANSTISYSIIDNVGFYVFTSNINGNSITLPCNWNSDWAKPKPGNWILYTSSNLGRATQVYTLSGQGGMLYGVTAQPRCELPYSIRPVSTTQGINMGLSVNWSSHNLTSYGFTQNIEDVGDAFLFAEITPTTKYAWDNYMCTLAECGTDADPLTMEWEDFDNPLVNRLDYQGLRQYHQKVKQAIDEVRKAIPAPTTVDTELDDQSENAIANKAVAKKIAELPKTVNKVAPDENGNIDVPKITDEELNKTYIDMGISGTGFDTARRILGNDWRLPTDAERKELFDNCDIELDSENKITYVKSRLNNNQLVFKLGEQYGGQISCMVGNSYNGSLFDNIIFAFRYDVAPQLRTIMNRNTTARIRPVTTNPALGVDLGLPSGVRWSSRNLCKDGFAESELAFGDAFTYGYGIDYSVIGRDKMGTSADPLMEYYEELEETDHYLNTRGLNIVRKQMSDKMSAEVSTAVNALGIKNVRWADESKEELIIELNS